MQSSFNIPNQSFPSFRSDLNDALLATVTLSSGGTAPATTFPGMLWYDDSVQVIKQRNSTDTAWGIKSFVNGDSPYRSHSGDPTNTVTPLYKGEILFDSTNSNYYYSSGTNNADWKRLIAGGADNPYPARYQDIKIEYVSSTEIRIKAGSRLRSSNDDFNIVFAVDELVDLTTSGSGGILGGAAFLPSTHYYIYAIADSAGTQVKLAVSPINKANPSSPILPLPSGFDTYAQCNLAITTNAVTVPNPEIIPFTNPRNGLFVYNVELHSFIRTGNVTRLLNIIGAGSGTGDASAFVPEISRYAYLWGATNNSSLAVGETVNNQLTFGVGSGFGATMNGVNLTDNQQFEYASNGSAVLEVYGYESTLYNN